MGLKDLKIVPPEGMEWYQEGNEIKFKPIKELNLSYVYKKLFANEDAWRPSEFGVAKKYSRTPNWPYVTNCTSQRQAEKLIAINKLLNVAKYLNGDWMPNWEEGNNEFKYYINIYHKKLSISYITHYNGSVVYFKSEKLAQQAVDILGEETIKLILSTDW